MINIYLTKIKKLHCLRNSWCRALELPQMKKNKRARCQSTNKNLCKSWLTLSKL